jgi:UDP-N-acetylmuramoyl-tripeptide--D-alanyl-D-alanine ligase
MGVRQEESAIISGLNPAGLLVVNGDDESLLEAVSQYKGKRITFGFKPTNDLFATDIYTDDTGTRFQLNGSPTRTVYVPLLGKHTAANALAAIAVARRLGLTESDILESLATAKGPEMRLQLQLLGNITILNDAYNANPASVKAALDTLMSLTSNGRKLAILGDMRELGAASDRYHKEIGQYVATLAIDELTCVGPQSRLIAQEASASGFTAPITHYIDSTIAASHISIHTQPNDLLLLKGSRGIRLEAIAEALSQGRSSNFLKVAG